MGNANSDHNQQFKKIGDEYYKVATRDNIATRLNYYFDIFEKQYYQKHYDYFARRKLIKYAFTDCPSIEEMLRIYAVKEEMMWLK